MQEQGVWYDAIEYRPVERIRPYQVVAVTIKVHESGNYEGQNKKTIVQDWAVRLWPQNFKLWLELPDTPTKELGVGP